MDDPTRRPRALDRRVPFVDAVFRIMEDGEGYDAAMRLLKDGERRHGLRLFDERGEPPDEGQQAAGPVGDPNLWRMELDSAVRTCLRPFLSETYLVLTGEDFANDHCVEFTADLVGRWTWRAWASVVAEWANATGWMPDSSPVTGHHWEYLDFYMEYQQARIIEGYHEWARVVREVIRRKCTAEGLARL